MGISIVALVWLMRITPTGMVPNEDTGSFFVAVSMPPATSLEKTEAAGIDLQFSGHTHHGQIWPINWVTDYIFEQSHGYRQWGNSHVYVSSGLSLWGPPFRIGTHSEMVIFNFQ